MKHEEPNILAVAVLVTGLSFGFTSQARAFGLGDITGAAGDAGAAKDAMDKAKPQVDAFEVSARRTLHQLTRALEYMSYATATNEDRAKIKQQMADDEKITDPQEQESKDTAIMQTDSAQQQKDYDSGVLQARLGEKDEIVEKAVTASTINSAIAGFRIAVLIKQGQTLIDASKQNKLAAPAYVSVLKTVPWLVWSLKISANLVAENVKLLRGANVVITVPTSSDAKAADMTFEP
jgi:hypothetical protein